MRFISALLADCLCGLSAFLKPLFQDVLAVLNLQLSLPFTYFVLNVLGKVLNANPATTDEGVKDTAFHLNAAGKTTLLVKEEAVALNARLVSR